MKNRIVLKVLAVFTALVLVAGSVALYSGTDVGKRVGESGEKGVISLEAPPFFSIASARGGGGGAGGSAFPEDEAGISAYINTSQTIDLDKLKTIFTEVIEVGDNYIIGITPISDWGGDIDVHVYADTDGWIVAYLKNNEPAAKIMQWGTADPDNPVITTITTTILEDAQYKAGEAASVGISPSKIKYYDFEFPNANNMTLFIRTRASDGTNMHQVEIPADYMLFEASYYHYAYSGYDSLLKVDETTVSDAPSTAGSKWWRAFGSYGGRITTGELHKIELYYDEHYMGSAGVATVLIYRTA